MVATLNLGPAARAALDAAWFAKTFRDPPASSVDPEERAAQQSSLSRYVRDAWHVVEPATEYVSGWHIDCICEHLQAVSRGELRNLLINIPPRHMKSLTVSVFWPTWTWATRPAVRWLYSSYAESLSVRDSLKCRRLIQSPWYQERWGNVFGLTGDQNLKGRYDNDRGGYRIATSVSGSVTGEGGDFLVADDPHNISEGESDLNRENVLTWWDEVMSTRLNDPKTGSKVIVMQRVHHQDLTGHLIERGGWHVLSLSARHEPGTSVHVCNWGSDKRTAGELLWPERFDEPTLTVLERDLGPYAAAGQLQQNPVPRVGAVFQDDWFRPLPSHLDLPGPENGPSLRQTLVRVLYWDLAYSESQMADYTAACTIGVDASDNHYILGMLRQRTAESRLDEVIAAHIVAMRPWVVGIEEAAYKANPTRDLIVRVNRLLSKAGYSCTVVAVKVDRDKVTRAQVPAGRAKLGMVYADRTASWWPDFSREVLGFPKMAHDDMVDALSGSCQLAIETAAVTQWGDEETPNQQYQWGKTPKDRNRGGR